MFHNSKYPIVLFLASFILFLGAALVRITHWPGAQLLAVDAVIAQVIAITWLMFVFIKSRYLVAVFLVGFILLVAGVLLRIMHWPGGLFLICSMILVEIGAVISLIIIIIKTPKS